MSHHLLPTALLFAAGSLLSCSAEPGAAEADPAPPFSGALPGVMNGAASDPNSVASTPSAPSGNGSGGSSSNAATAPSPMASTAGTAGAPGQAGNAPPAEAGVPGAPDLMPANPEMMAGNGAPDPMAEAPAPSGMFSLGGASRCAGGALSVCESFEAAPLGESPPLGWSTSGYGNRSFAVVDDDSARGDRSFRIDVAANQGAVVAMLTRGNLGSLGARHFGRSFTKIQAPAPTGFVHFDVFEARGTFNGQANMVRWASTGTDVGTAANNWSWIYNVQSTDHGEFGSEGPRSAHPRAGEWMCLEWSMEAAAAEARFWFDGVEIEYLHIDTERSEIPVFDAFNIGFQKFQQPGPWRVWLDEVAFDDERIGCDN